MCNKKQSPVFLLTLRILYPNSLACITCKYLVKGHFLKLEACCDSHSKTRLEMKMLQHQAGDIDTVVKWIQCFVAALSQPCGCPRTIRVLITLTTITPRVRIRITLIITVLDGTGQEYYPSNYTTQNYNNLHNNPPSNPNPPRPKPTIEEVARMQPRELYTGCGWPLDLDGN